MANYDLTYTGQQVEDRLGEAGTAYQKPVGGIPSTDMTSSVQSSLALADTAIQNVKTINNQSIIGTGNIEVVTDISGKADKATMTAGIYKSVTVNNQGVITAGTNPTTLAGYGITDGYTQTEGQALEAAVDARLDDQDALLATLNGSDVEVVSSVPASGVANKIYRVYSTNSYTDYMFNAGALTTPIPIATYSYPGVDDVPTAGSDKLVKSNGVYNSVTPEVNIDLSIYSEFQFCSSPSKAWGIGYKGRFVNVEPNATYKIIANADGSTIIPLKSYIKPTNGGSYANNIATGYTDRVNLVANEIMIFVAPADCHLLYVQSTAGSGNITPTISHIGKVQYPDNVLNIESGNGISNKCVTSSVCTCVKMGYIETISGYTITSTFQWYKNNDRNSVLYKVNAGEQLHIQSNSAFTSLFTFISSKSGISDGATVYATSPRHELAPNTTLDIIVPENTQYLCATSTTELGLLLPSFVGRYETIKSNPIIADNMSFAFEGNGMETQVREFAVKKGHIYNVSINKGWWAVSSIVGSGYSKLDIDLDGTLVHRSTRDVVAPLKTVVYAKNNGFISISYRGDVGESLEVTIEDVTTKFNKKIYDISFVDNGSALESMLVKLGKGDIVRYSVQATTGMTILKAFSKAMRDATYLEDSVVAAAAGTAYGTYAPQEDVFVAMYSTTGSSPRFEVFNYGDSEEGSVVSPYQLVFKPENAVTLLSSTDNDASEYENIKLNYGQIIPIGNKYVMLYQGFGTATVSEGNWSSTIMMAISDDGLNWQRGLPAGVSAPYPGTNIIFKSGTIVGEFSQEVVNEFSVVKVNDKDYPYRMFTMIRQEPDTITGECGYFFKSNDLVHWESIRKITNTAHDSFSCMISYGDMIKVYLRMWDYTQPLTEQRMIGYMWIDIEGNVIVPPTGLFGHGLYNPGCIRIDSNKELFIPTHFHVSSGMSGVDCIETWIKDGDVVRYAPSYNSDALRTVEDNDGWVWGRPVAIGRKQYFLYSVCNSEHGSDPTKGDLRLCPLDWITYNSSNQSSGIYPWG